MNSLQTQKFRALQRAFHSGGMARNKVTTQAIQLTPMRMAMFAENPELMEDIEAVIPKQDKNDDREVNAYPSLSHVSGAEGMKLMMNNI